MRRSATTVLLLLLWGWAAWAEPVSLAFDQADVREVLRVVLAEHLKLSYVVDPEVRATLTLYLNGDWSPQELLEVFRQALAVSGLCLREGKGGIYELVRQERAARLAPPVCARAPSGPGVAVCVRRLTFLSPSAALNAVKGLLSRGALAVPLEDLCSLVLCDRADNVRTCLGVLDALDVDQLQGLRFRIVKLATLEAREVASRLQEVIKGLLPKGPLQRRTLAFALEGANAVVLISPQQALLRSLEEWAREMDRQGETVGERVYVYFVKHVKAEDLARVLTDLYREGPARVGKRVMAATKKPQEAVATGVVTGRVRIIADAASNALLIRATPRDYEAVRRTIEQLDVLPRQVLIEAIIAEITLTKSLEYGIEWYMRAHGAKIGHHRYDMHIYLEGGRPLSADAALGATGYSGFVYGIFRRDQLRGLLTALAEETRMRVLSTPHVLALDNQEAQISVGEEVPIVTQEVTHLTTEAVTNVVQYRDTGVILKVKPHVGPGGVVKLEVRQEVSQAMPTVTSGINSPTFLKREAETTLVVHDGQTIVMGGIIEEKIDRTHTGIPLLKDLPLLGHLFGSRSRRRTRTELFVAITPRVITSAEQARAITEEFRRRVESLRGLLRERRR